KLAQPPKPQANPNGVAIGNAAMPAIGIMPGFGVSYQCSAVVRLQLGKKQARMLKTVEGTVPVEVQTPPEPMITVKNILKAAGKTTKGARGGSIKILKAGKDDNGDYQIKFQLTKPAGVIDGGFGGFGGGVGGFGGVGPGIILPKARRGLAIP